MFRRIMLACLKPLDFAWRRTWRLQVSVIVILVGLALILILRDQFRDRNINSWDSRIVVGWYHHGYVIWPPTESRTARRQLYANSRTLLDPYLYKLEPDPLLGNCDTQGFSIRGDAVWALARENADGEGRLCTLTQFYASQWWFRPLQSVHPEETDKIASDFKKSGLFLDSVRTSLSKKLQSNDGEIPMRLYRAPNSVAAIPLTEYYVTRWNLQHREGLDGRLLVDQIHNVGIYADVLAIPTTGLLDQHAVLVFILSSDWMAVWEFDLTNANENYTQGYCSVISGFWTLRDEFPAPFLEHFKGFVDGDNYCFITRDEGAFYVASPKNADDPGAKRVEKVKDRILAIVNFPDHSYAFTMNEYFRVGKDIQLKPFKPKPVAETEPYRSRDMLWQCVKVVEAETAGK